MRTNPYGFIVNESVDPSMGYIVSDSLGDMIPARLAPTSMGSMGSWLDDAKDFISNPSDAIESLYKDSAIYQSLSSAEKGVIDLIGPENYNKVISKIQQTSIGQAITNPTQAMATYISSKSGVPEADLMNGSAIIIKNADGSITVQRRDGSMATTGGNNTAMYVAIGGGAILLAGLIVFMMKRSNGKKSKKGRK